MAQNKPRQHHYIPQFLLENFTNEDGYLWAACKTTRTVFRTTPHNLFKERDLYISYDIASSASEPRYNTDYATREQELGELEGRAVPVVNKIIESARKGQPPELSYEELKMFMEFFLATYRRNPITLEQITADYDDVFYEAASKIAIGTGYPPPVKAELCQRPEIHELINVLKQNTKSRFAIGEHTILRDKDEAYMRDAGLRIINILNPKRSLIIGSRAFSGQFTAEPRWLPIAADTAVGLTNDPGSIKLILMKPDNSTDEKINRVNAGSTKRSKVFAGRSETLIRSLMK